jgi:hypothetical protein
VQELGSEASAKAKASVPMAMKCLIERAILPRKRLLITKIFPKTIRKRKGDLVYIISKHF